MATYAKDMDLPGDGGAGGASPVLGEGGEAEGRKRKKRRTSRATKKAKKTTTATATTLPIPQKPEQEEQQEQQVSISRFGSDIEADTPQKAPSSAMNDVDHAQYQVTSLCKSQITSPQKNDQLTEERDLRGCHVVLRGGWGHVGNISVNLQHWK